MKLNEAVDIYKGNQQIKMLAIGKDVIWKKGAFLKVVPDNIWLMNSNNYQADVQILSNVKWDVK